MAPLSEEFLYRGAILGGLNKFRFNRKTSILLSSLIFALYHLNTLLLYPSVFNFVVLQVLAAFVVRLTLGQVYAKNRSISQTVFLHSAFNGSFLLASNLF